MAEMLGEFGIEKDRITLDDSSADTFDSAVASASFVWQRSLSGIVVCSDRYHLPRIMLLLAVLGVKAISGPLDPGRAGSPKRHWLWMQAREAVALPYDLCLMLARRRAILRSLNLRRAGSP